MMFIFSKLIPILLLPPGIIILLLLIIFIRLRKMKAVFTKALLLFMILTLYSLSIKPLADLLLLPLEKSYPPLEYHNLKYFDYIVVLGGGTVHNSPDEQGQSSLRAEALKRLVYGYRLHLLTDLPIIICGGRVFEADHLPGEAETGQRLLLELGVKPDKIHLEKKSRNTWENAWQVKQMYSPAAVILVTSAYHMKRSMLCFKKNQINCRPAPTDYKTQPAPFNWMSFMPLMANFYYSSKALREYIGIIYYHYQYSILLK